MTDVIISPSSQTANQYAGGTTGVEDSEHRHMRDIAPLIHDILQSNGIDSQILWSTDLYTRVMTSNAIMPKLHFALHSNASGTSYGAGTYIYQRGTLSEVMANKVQARLAALTPWPDNGVIQMNHYETRTTAAYAVIAEVAYHDKIIPAEWIRTHKREIAVACAQGIIDALAAAYGGKYADIAARPLMLSGGGGTSPVVIAPTTPTTPTVPEEDDVALTAEQAWTLSNMNTAVGAIRKDTWALRNKTVPELAAQVVGLNAAVDALGQSLGLDAGVIEATVAKAVADALARIEITVGE